MKNHFITEELYTSYKPLLFSLAYRMLGSVGGAEDIVHESFLSLNRTSPDQIRDIKSYLCKIVTNLCINHLKSESKQRELYVGTWLPEPLVIGERANSDPYAHYLQKENISTAFMILLQQLSWVERAVFLLREVLQLDYNEISEIVGKSSSNCRQIFRRAKLSISSQFVSSNNVSLEQVKEQGEFPNLQREIEKKSSLVEQFMHALATGNVKELMRVLSTEAVFYADGGGKVTASPQPIKGAVPIARLLGNFSKNVPIDFSFNFVNVNGQPGIVMYSNGLSFAVISFQLSDNNDIAAVYTVVNPEKLKHVN